MPSFSVSQPADSYYDPTQSLLNWPPVAPAETTTIVSLIAKARRIATLLAATGKRQRVAFMVAIRAIGVARVLILQIRAILVINR